MCWDIFVWNGYVNIGLINMLCLILKLKNIDMFLIVVVCVDINEYFVFEV